MRQRTTWQSKSPTASQVAATRRQADVFTMNQDHKQPAMETAYANGDPDSWAETPSKTPVEPTERNELGLPEFQSTTFKHKDSDTWNDGKKYDNARSARSAAERKAMAATKIASILLPGASPEVVSDQAIDLMGLSDRAVVACLRRLDKTATPRVASMTTEQRTRRAYACAKLAHRVLTASSSEAAVESLGRTFMALEDSVLRSILKQVRTADEASKEETEEKEEKPETASAEAPAAEEAPAETASGEGASALTADEMQMLDALVPAAPAAPAAGLDALLAPPAAPMEPVHMNLELAPAAPALAGEIEIAFDEEDADPAEIASLASGAQSLDQLFAENPEVIAQREIQAASDEQFRQEMSGFQPARQASAGARKIGNVKVASAEAPAAPALSNLWD